MVKKVYYTWKDVEHMIMAINNLMYADNWRPDYIVGLTRGGLVPAVIMSNMTGIPMHTLDVRFRDTNGLNGPETNCWMAEDAYGYVQEMDSDGIYEKVTSHPDRKKNILIFDDINDSGRTMNWIKQDWQGGCLPDNPNWNTVWGQNVRFAALLDNQASSFHDIDYTAMEINKAENPTWIVFPWEGERDYGNF
jgi:hypoxanthine phosphoribosyltransferase